MAFKDKRRPSVDPDVFVWIDITHSGSDVEAVFNQLFIPGAAAAENRHARYADNEEDDAQSQENEWQEADVRVCVLTVPLYMQKGQ
jgi:hypothetical protein